MNDNYIFSHNWDVAAVEDAKKLDGPVLIIGASGFIGAKLFFSLSQYRDDIYAASRNIQLSWRLREFKSSKLFNVDITDYDSIKNLISRIKPRTVINLSAYGAYSRQTDVELIHKTNYFGVLHILRALSDTGCSAFIQAGSSSEYGLNCDHSREDDELMPNSDYSVAKISASFLIKYYGKFYNFPCINLRLFSVFGPWEERDRLIPTVLINGLQGRYPRFVDKNISRDFVYIDDCTSAIVKACLTVCQTHPGSSLNIATGVKTTMEDVSKVAAKLFQIPGEPVFSSMTNRKWDVLNWYGSPELAEKIMGWKFRTSFEEGMKLNIDWEKHVAENLKYVLIPKKTRKISVIIACYKDNQSIPILYENISNVFRESGYDYEIIFINDASPYNDEDVIIELAQKDTHVLGVSHSRNFGSQSGFISGMEMARGDAVILMDGDGQDPPEMIPKLIEKWEDGFDIVYGERIKREAPFYMQIFYKLFYRLFRTLSDIKIPVDAGDFSLIDRKAVNYLLKFTEKDVFLRGLRAWIGFKQTGVPYVRPERLFGKSTNSFFKNIWWAKKGIFSFSIKPLHYIQILGVIVFFIAIGLGVFYSINYFLKPPSNAKGITTVVLLLLGLGSIQLISTSILGDYIGKITEEVKNRPKFIRNKIIYNGKKYEKEEDLTKIIDEIKRKNI